MTSPARILPHSAAGWVWLVWTSANGRCFSSTESLDSLGFAVDCIGLRLVGLDGVEVTA